MGNSCLMGRLIRCDSEKALFAEVLAIGRERGFELEERELGEIVRANRRQWLERWTWQ